MAGAQSKPKILVGMPAYGAMVSLPTCNGLINLFLSFQASGIAFEKEFLGNESLITRARNRIVARFLETDCTHLLFVDADVGFRPKDAAALVRADVDVIVGAYPMKAISWAAAHDAVKAGHPPEHLPELSALYAVNATLDDTATGRVSIHEKNGSKYIEVLEGATGFMLLRRNALERFVTHYRDEIRYLADYDPYIGQTHHMVFQADRDPAALARGELGRYLSEDYHFCRKWQAMGGRVHLCLDAQLSHMGSHIFEGDVGRLFLLDEPKPVAAPEVATQVQP